MDQLRSDLKQTFRSLRRAPLFTVVAVGTLALGIGVGTTIFTFVDALLLRPLPVADPDELVAVFSSWEGEPFSTSSLPDFRDLREGTSAAELFGHAVALATFQHGERSRMLVGEMVTGNFFAVTGVRPHLGRLIEPADDLAASAPRTVVLGHGLWQRAFEGAPAAIGRQVRLNGNSYEIVGIAPPGFHGLMPGLSADFWVPSVRVDEVDAAGQIHGVAGDVGSLLAERRGYRWLWVKGRLAAGATAAQVGAQTAAVMARLVKEAPLTNDGRGTVVRPLSEVRVHPDVDRVLGSASAVLLGCVALLLLVVCANVANMVLSRAQSRQREVAIRLALGSGRARLVRALLAESLVLALAGAGLGLLLAHGSTALLLRAMPPLPIQLNLDVGTDGRVAVFAITLAAGSALLLGLLPARRASRPDLAVELRGGTRSTDGPESRFSLRNGLVVAQVAVSTVLLVAAALLGRGVLAARSTPLGFEPQRVAAVGLNLGSQGYTSEAAATYVATLRERVAALPGVAAAGVATRVPFDVNVHFGELYPDTGAVAPDKPGLQIDQTAVDASYFAALGVPVLRGRAFDGRDAAGAAPVAVVNRAMARAVWGSEEVLGRTFRVGRPDAEPVTVVGVVADYKVRTVGEAPRPFAHFPLAQQRSDNVYVLARSAAADALPLVQQVRRAALELDPTLALSDTTTLAGFQLVSLYPVRMGATLLTAFGALALALASVGLYGVIAYSVARRSRELGVRVALGAAPRSLLGLVVRRGMALVGVGMAIGLGLAAAGARSLSGVLHGVSALDPLAFAAAAAVLALAGWAANAVPALRAARTDPAVVLRGE
jgi:predicted permease